MFPKAAIKIAGVLNPLHEDMKCLLHVFKISCALNFEHMQNAFYVFKYNRFRTLAEHIIPFWGNIYPNICSIFLYKHILNPQRLNWSKLKNLMFSGLNH